MLVALTVRKLKPGAFDEFEKAWAVGDLPPGFVRAYTARSLDDPDTIVSFGLFDGTIDDLRRAQSEFDYAAQRAAVDAVVESTGTDGIFEVAIEVG
jgi:hypothetical protein